MDRGDRVDVRVARFAGRNRGVVSRAQLLALGRSSTGIARWIAAERLHRLLSGVYLYGHPVPPPLAWETAALLATGPSAVLSHHSAAAL